MLQLVFRGDYFMTTSDYVKNLSLEDIEGEIWVTIKESPYYQVSNYGRVKAIGKKKWNSKVSFVKKPQIRKQHIGSTGYYMVGIECESINRIFRVHRLIADAFIENPNNYPFINHLDGNKLNNSIPNLQRCDARMNIIHARETGLVPSRIGIPNIKKRYPVIQMDMDGNIIKIWDSLSESVIKMNNKSIGDCIRGRQSHAGGFTWKYLDESKNTRKYIKKPYPKNRKSSKGKYSRKPKSTTFTQC